MDDALGVDEDLDVFDIDIKKPAGLDDLQAFVHQGGGVDGDIFAHVPVGVIQSLSGVTAQSSRSPKLRNGPPEAVRISLLTSAFFPASSAWAMALCSLSMGSRVTLQRCTAAMTRWPAMTRVSLLARAMFFPASMAAR